VLLCGNHHNAARIVSGWRTFSILQGSKDGCVYACRHIEATYGPTWRSPDEEYHGTDPETPDGDKVRIALHRRLSVTAWGNIPWERRRQRCSARQERGIY
jgi:hypothetical protein